MTDTRYRIQRLAGLWRVYRGRHLLAVSPLLCVVLREVIR